MSFSLGLQDPIAAFNESLKHGTDGTSDKQTVSRNSFVIGVSEDPIAKFNASLKSDGKASTEGFISVGNNSVNTPKTPKAGQEQVSARTPGDNDFSSDEVLKDSIVPGRGQMVVKQDAIGGCKSEELPTRMLRSTPQRSTYHAKVLANNSDMKLNEFVESKAGNKSKSALGSEINENVTRTPMKSNAISLLQEMNSDAFTPRRIKSTKYFKDLLEKERLNFIRMNENWKFYLETEELSEEGLYHFEVNIIDILRMIICNE